LAHSNVQCPDLVAAVLSHRRAPPQRRTHHLNQDTTFKPACLREAGGCGSVALVDGGWWMD
jgi:hypothetical protein